MKECVDVYVKTPLDNVLRNSHQASPRLLPTVMMQPPGPSSQEQRYRFDDSGMTSSRQICRKLESPAKPRIPESKAAAQALGDRDSTPTVGAVLSASARARPMRGDAKTLLCHRRS